MENIDILLKDVWLLYDDLKVFICCEVHGASRDIYIALTVIGSLAIVLATLCSARIIQGSITARRKRSTQFPDVQRDVGEVTKV